MGFGLLIIGYIITYFGAFLAQISAFTNILGAGIILLSLRKLIYQNKLFIVSAIFAFLLEASSIISLGIQIFSGSESNVVAIAFAYIADASLILLNIFLMLGIFLLAKEVSLPKIAFMSMLTASAVGMGTVFYILCEIIEKNYALTIVYLIFQIVSAILSIIVIFNSYVRICYEGDEKMQKQGTGMPFLDTLNNMFDKVFSKNKIDKGNGKKK